MDGFRLSVRKLDQSFFEENIQRKHSLKDFLRRDPVEFSDSQKHMFKNMECLKEELYKLDDEERHKLAIYVAQKCFLVVVSASDVGSAHRIFSVMNDRGLDLSPTDVLKAVVLGAIPSQSRDEYAVKWEDIEEKLGRDDFRNLFAHIRMIYRREKMRGTLVNEFQTYVLGSLSSERATEFVDDVLQPYADAYKIVSEAVYQSTNDSEKVNALLRHLKRLDNFDWIPPAIAYFRLRKGETAETDRLLKFTRDLERLAYGLFIRRANINERIRRYAQVIRAIQNGDELFEDGTPSPAFAHRKDGNREGTRWRHL